MTFTYKVFVQPRAKADLLQAYRWAAQHAPDAAERWLSRFEAALQSLATFPERCGVAPESDRFEFEVRQLLFGRASSVWRALFIIRDGEVHILHVRHGAMSAAQPHDLHD